MKTTALLLVVLMASALSGCLEEGLDTDPVNLPDSVDIDIQGGIVDGNPILYIDVNDNVPPETIDVLVISGDEHVWIPVDSIRYTTSYGLSGLCESGCDIVVRAFYMGKVVSIETIQI